MTRLVGLIIILVAMSGCSDKSLAPEPDCFYSSTPYCRDGCKSECGCFPCFEVGDELCNDGKVARCQGQCWEIIEECSDTDACIMSTCVESVEDCDAVREAYELELHVDKYSAIAAVVREGESILPGGVYGEGCPGNCEVVSGDCRVGLETCWLVGRRTPEMDRLAALYERLGCPGAKECDCPPLEVTFSCQYVDDPDVSHNACVAE